MGGKWNLSTEFQWRNITDFTERRWEDNIKIKKHVSRIINTNVTGFCEHVQQRSDFKES